MKQCNKNDAEEKWKEILKNILKDVMTKKARGTDIEKAWEKDWAREQERGRERELLRDCRWWDHCNGDTAVKRQVEDLRSCQGCKRLGFKGKRVCVCVCIHLCVHVFLKDECNSRGCPAFCLEHNLALQTALGLSQGRQASIGSEDLNILHTSSAKQYVNCYCFICSHG